MTAADSEVHREDLVDAAVCFSWPSSEGADYEGSELHEQLHPSAGHHPEDPPGGSSRPVALHYTV